MKNMRWYLTVAGLLIGSALSNANAIWDYDWATDRGKKMDCDKLVGELATLCKGEPVYAETDKGIIHLYPWDNHFYTKDGWWRVYVHENSYISIKQYEACRDGTTRGPSSWHCTSPTIEGYWIVRTWPDGGLRAQELENAHHVVEDYRTGKPVDLQPVDPFDRWALDIKHVPLKYGVAWRAYTGQELTRVRQDKIKEMVEPAGIGMAGSWNSCSFWIENGKLVTGNCPGD